MKKLFLVRLQSFNKEVVVPIGVAELWSEGDGVGGVVAVLSRGLDQALEALAYGRIDGEVIDGSTALELGHHECCFLIVGGDVSLPGGQQGEESGPEACEILDDEAVHEREFHYLAGASFAEGEAVEKVEFHETVVAVELVGVVEEGPDGLCFGIVRTNMCGTQP